MKISSLFQHDTIFLDKNFDSKDKALQFLSQELKNKMYISDAIQAKKLFQKREIQSSTGIGQAIAMPHISDDVVLKNTIMFVRTTNLDWNAIDNLPIKYIFAIVLSKNERDNSHLEIIQKLSQLLINPKFVTNLETIKTAQEFLNLIDDFEAKLNNNKYPKKSGYDIVVVTACPTGIAHTFLAKDRLYQQAQEMNLSIKVETQGAEGIDNKLTLEDIKNAKGVILAIDREIEKSRFANIENIIEISTQKAINNSKEQIEKILKKQGKKLNVAFSTTQNNDQQISFKGFNTRIYRSLMQGISHMLPFIIFGGILIALGFILDTLIGLFQGINLNDKTFLSSFGFNYKSSKLIFNIGKLAMGLAVPILSAYIAFSLIGRQGLLPGFVVGGIATGQLKDTYGFLKESIARSSISNPDSFLGTGSGFVGGILGAFFAAAMIIVFTKYIFKKLPKTLTGIKNILFVPVLGTLTIALLFWVVNIVLIYINLGLVLFLQLFQGKLYLAWLLGLILGLMMASDLGGPINKAAYIFGTLSIANGTSTISMAAIMIAGMVPPLGISLSMFISKKLWAKEDIETGRISNILFGLSFISEGAIPYTSKNPKILIPANLVSGAVAGLVSALLGINIIAPHGGIFVVFLAKTNLVQHIGTQIGLGITFFIGVLLIGAIAHATTIILATWFNKKYKNIFAKFKFKNNKKTA